MTILMSPLGFAAHLLAMEAKILAATERGLEKAARLIEKEAKSEIGEYQPEKGPFEAWQDLATSTVTGKLQAGFEVEKPLLRTGDMRDSLQHQVQVHGPGEGEAHVGSDSPVAVYQELGTSRIPPRSFLGGAAFAKAPEVRKILGDGVIAVIEGKKAI